MVWDVRWVDTAGDEVARLWRNDRFAKHRVAALRDLHARLAADPYAVGESRLNDRRITFLLDLSIQFTIEPATGVVRIERVHRVRRDWF